MKIDETDDKDAYGISAQVEGSPAKARKAWGCPTEAKLSSVTNEILKPIALTLFKRFRVTVVA